MINTDILVLGTGIAGLSFAIKTARRRPDLGVKIMAKSSADVTNTQFAQGGIAAVMDELSDSFEDHVNDTLASGQGYCDKEIVKMVVSQAPLRLAELMALGVEFDQNGSRWDLALEGGHSHGRIMHKGDATGAEIMKKLLAVVRAMPNIEILENHFVLDLVTEGDPSVQRCTGAFFMDHDNALRYVRSRVTVLSTGGSGQIFAHTTNARVATGDGVAIAKRANARIRDMDCMQFHPTAMYEPDKNPCFLLSEALRGFGAHVINADGRRFLFRYDLRGELATRDILSAAIHDEMAKSGMDHVYLDCRHIEQVLFEKHFPSIRAYCLSRGIDPGIDVIPIVPVAHYQCGGIETDRFGQTSVPNLFALGECARTGMHGRNRLASNSLLEAVVFAHQASEQVCAQIDSVPRPKTMYVNIAGNRGGIGNKASAAALVASVRETMQQFHADGNCEAGIGKLSQLEEEAAKLYSSGITRETVEAINMIEVAQLMIKESKNNRILTQKQLQ